MVWTQRGEDGGRAILDLGPAVTAVNVRAAGMGRLPDGTPIAFALGNGHHTTFSVIEVLTGRRIFAKQILGTTLGRWVTQAPDSGDIYFSAVEPTPAALYRFDIRRFSLRHIEDRVGGERSLHSGAVDESGVLWFGTYPHAKLMSYDPASDEIRDHGPLTAAASYVYAVGVVDGKIWAGTGPTANLFEIDPVSGERSQLHPPDHVMRGTEWCVGIEQRNHDVLVRLTPGGRYTTAIYHTRTRTWAEDVIVGTHGAQPSPVAADGTTYLLTEGPALVGYHTHQHRVVASASRRPMFPAAATTDLNTYALGLVRVPELGLTGQSVVGLTTGGTLWFTSITTGQTRVLPAEIMPTTAEPGVLATGPDGHVYVSSRVGSGVISRIDQHSLDRTQLRGPHETDAIAAHGDLLAISSCPGPQIHLGDPIQTWEWEVNPRAMLTAESDGLHFQERAVALVSTGQFLAAGTVATHRGPGGALALLDPRTGHLTVHREVVNGHEVVCLLHRDGLLYGATSVHGGGSNKPASARAQLFIWDIAEGSTIWHEPVGAGSENVSGLLWGPDGLLVGTTSRGELFEFDADRRCLVNLVELPLAAGREQIDEWGHGARTVYDPTTDSYLATRSGHLVQVERITHRVSVLSRSIERIARAGNGRLFALDETNLYLITVAAPD